jgi:ERF superfamily
MNNKSNTDEKQEKVLLSVRHDAEELIAKAIDKNVPVETMERLLVMRRELKAEWAKAQFDNAMSAFQAECPIIKKTKGVKTNSGELAYKYAPLESIVDQVKNLLSKHGFSYSVNQPESRAGYIKVAFTVKHKYGHSETTSVELPLGNKTSIMSQTQVEAAALTFAKRYAFCNAFGILTGDEDTDAKPAVTERVTTPKNPANQGVFNGGITYFKAKLIRDLLDKKGYTVNDLYKKYKVENILHLDSEQADQIIENLKKLPDFDEGDRIANDAHRALS